MIRTAILLASLAAPAASPAQTPSERGIGGLALRPCSDFVGLENMPLLAQSVDWILGYLAGRIDRGDTPDPAAALTTTDQIELVTAILEYCSENPNKLLLAAARDHARRAFGTLSVPMLEEAAPETAPRPERPSD